MPEQQWPSGWFRFFYHLTEDVPTISIFVVVAIGIGQAIAGHKPDVLFADLALVNLGVCLILLGLHRFCFGSWNIEQQQLQAEEFVRQFPTYHEDLARRSPWLWFLYSNPMPRPLLAVRIGGLVLLLGGVFFLIVGAVRWWDSFA